MTREEVIDGLKKYIGDWYFESPEHLKQMDNYRKLLYKAIFFLSRNTGI